MISFSATGKVISSLAHRFRGDDFKSKCARSGVILGIGAFVAKFLGFGSKIVLARLLVPQEIGLMVMIVSLTQLFEVLTEVGIKQSVIQHKNGADPEYINMAWWFQSLRGMGLYAVAFVVTPWLCDFYFQSKPEVLTYYSMAELIILVRVAFLSVLFNGFISPRAYVLEKKFRFALAVIIMQGGFVLGTVITIILAFALRNVWAIVIGFASIGFSRCLMSYVFCPFRPIFAYDRESFQGLFSFAKGVLGLPVLTYIAFNVDVLVAGKLVPTSLVGLYGMALVLAMASSDLFNRMISPVLLPAFAEKQDDRKVLCRVVLKTTKITALIILPFTALAIICSKTILALVYGVVYSEVAVPFAFLCVYVLFLIQGSILGTVFFGIGQPGKHRAFVGLRALILVVFIYPGIKSFGLTGAAVVVFLASFVAMCVQVTLIRKAIGLNVLRYAVSWLPGLALTVLVLVIILLVRAFWPDLPRLHLTIGILSCGIAYLIGLFWHKLVDKFKKAGLDDAIVAE